jgi:hypothetical protein
MMGSSRPKHDNVSLMDSQKATGLSVLGARVDGIGIRTGGFDAGGTGVGGEVRPAASGTCEGSVVNESKAGSAGAGAIATIAESLSIFLSYSRNLLGG